MKLLVCSDSHGVLQYIREAIEREKPDYLVHLGDYMRDADAVRRQYHDLPVVSVRGNCDFDHTVPERLLQEWDGVRILLTHGHRYGVKSGLLQLDLAAREAQADIVMFGHTHIPLCSRVGECWFVNPGTCGLVGRGPSYALVEIKTGVPTCQIHTFK